MQIRNLLRTASLAVILSISSTAYAATTAKDFVHKASVANEFEIETSKLALEKSQNGDVKTLAQQMIDDHTKTGQELEDTLQSSHTDLTPDTALDNKHQVMLNKLQTVSADQFDSTYAGMQKDAHKDAIKLFTAYSKNGDNSALKAFAAKTLPALQKHLKHVKQLNLAQ